MTLTRFLNRHSAPRAIFAAFSLLGWGGAVVFSQTVVLPAPQTQAGSRAAGNDSSRPEADPTRPETQPALDVDRDPLPSPDIDVSPATNAVQPAGSSAPGVSNGAGGAANLQGNQGTGKPASELEKQQNGVYILHANVDEVLLNCAVMDARGEPVMDLSRENFRVWEDGVEQTVNAAQHLDLPVSMGILIDDSGSMRDKRGTVNAAAYRLLNASNPQD